MLFTLLSEHPWSVHSRWSTNDQSTCTEESGRGAATSSGVAETMSSLSEPVLACKESLKSQAGRNGNSISNAGDTQVKQSWSSMLIKSIKASNTLESNSVHGAL